MRIRNGKLMNMQWQGSFRKLMQANTKTAPHVMSRIVRLTKILNEQNEHVNEIRKTTIEKYAPKGDDGKFIVKNGNYDLTSELENKINEELEPFMNEEFEFDMDKIPAHELSRMDLTAHDYVMLEDFIDIDQMEKPTDDKQ